MALNSMHPSFSAYREDWELMRDSYAGERVVKSRGTKYLPATAGQIIDGQGKPGTDGDNAYNSYKLRAVFPEYVSEAVEEFIGLLHKKPAVFELPDRMKDMLKKASSDGEGLQAFLRRINTEQLTSGRLGLLLDFPESTGDARQLPYIAMYVAETIPNWDDSHDRDDVDYLNMVVLDESGTKRDGLEWVPVTKYRVLQLVPLDTYREQAPENATIISQKAVPDASTGLVYVQGQFEKSQAGSESNLANYKPPVYLGQPLSEIPFVFINSKDTVAEPDKPPLVTLARLCMTIYRGEADYRQNLYMQAQDTLVTTGSLHNVGNTVNGTDGIRVGAGAHIGLDMGGDAKYIGVTATGLAEQRSALENDTKKAEGLAGKLVSPSAGKQESGDALTTRLSAQTASLQQIAQTGASALEKLLKTAAIWLGLDPEQVSVKPNLEFADTKFVPKELVDTMTARNLGAPLSLESIHANLKKQGVTDLDYQEEIDLIAEEDAASALKAAAKLKVMAEATGGLQPQRPGAKGNAPAPAPAGPQPAPGPAQR